MIKKAGSEKVDFDKLNEAISVKVLKMYDYLEDEVSNLENEEEIKKHVNFGTIGRKFYLTIEDAEMYLKSTCAYSNSQGNEKVCDLVFKIHENLVQARTKKPALEKLEILKDSRFSDVMKVVKDNIFNVGENYASSEASKSYDEEEVQNNETVIEEEPKKEESEESRAFFSGETKEEIKKSAKENVAKQNVKKEPKSKKPYFIVIGVLVFGLLIAKSYFNELKKAERANSQEVIAKSPEPESLVNQEVVELGKVLENSNEELLTDNNMFEKISDTEEMNSVPLIKIEDAELAKVTLPVPMSVTDKQAHQEEDVVVAVKTSELVAIPQTLNIDEEVLRNMIAKQVEAKMAQMSLVEKEEEVVKEEVTVSIENIRELLKIKEITSRDDKLLYNDRSFEEGETIGSLKIIHIHKKYIKVFDMENQTNKILTY